jgi:hypothetical protein
MSVSAAQAVEQDEQSWTLLTAQGHPAEKVRLYGELQPRLTLPDLKVDRMLWRGAVGYDLSPSLSLWAGYGWTPLYGDKSFGGGFRNEQRGFLQLLSTMKPMGGTLVNRTRLEDRLIEGADPSFRLRHMLRYTHAFEAGSPWLWAAHDEAFVNLNAAGGQKALSQGFDQNRLYVGVDRVIGQVTLEAGYLMNYMHRATMPEDLLGHVLLLSAALNLP